MDHILNFLANATTEFFTLATGAATIITIVSYVQTHRAGLHLSGFREFAAAVVSRARRIVAPIAGPLALGLGLIAVILAVVRPPIPLHLPESCPTPEVLILTHTIITTPPAQTPELTIEPPTCGPVGTRVVVKGDFLPSGEALRIGYAIGTCQSRPTYLDGSPQLVNNDGTLGYAFLWPEPRIGDYAICATDISTQHTYASVNLFRGTGSS